MDDDGHYRKYFEYQGIPDLNDMWKGKLRIGFRNGCRELEITGEKEDVQAVEKTVKLKVKNLVSKTH